MKAQVQTISVVFLKGDWHIQWPDGSVWVKTSAEEAIAEIRKADAKRAKKNPSVLTASVINWFGTPEGWKPPT
jgi:hypothetical protein